MDKFEASNGGVVEIFTDGRVVVSDFTRASLNEHATTTARRTHIDAAMVPALREFFQAERDEELGRWRWPENPDYVVYRLTDRHVRVLQESSGAERDYEFTDVWPVNGYGAAAHAFFDAHPIRQPWHDAKEGEVWVLTTRGVAEAWFVRRGRFRDVDGLGIKMPLDNSIITDGHRIHPGGGH